MQKLHIKLKAAYPIVLLLACIIIISSFGISYALGLSKQNAVWTGEHTSIAANSNDTYPYSRLNDTENPLDASKISKVGFDILYGTDNGLVQFLGEVPYEETFDDEERAEGWSGYNSYYEDTSLADTQYWGDTGVEAGSPVDVSQLEAVNSEDNIVSLRLYALSITSGKIWFWIGNIFYTIQLFFAGLGNKLVGLLVVAKNIDMLTILEALGLEELSDVITKSFIGDPETGTLSIFAGFCILMFIVSVAGMAIAYAKGGQKKMGWKDLLVPVFVGLIITGACLAGRITDLGSTIANLSNEVLYNIAGAATAGSQSGSVFITDVDDELYSSQVVQIQEMSLINKCFVDMQICTQFGVMDVEDLNIDNFGTTDTSLLLQGNDLFDSSVTFEEDFGNNIGYYFWYANSGASYKTHNNKIVPSTSPVSAERKLTNFVTWMQDTYNNNSTNNDVKSLLLNMTTHLASPDTGAGWLRMVIFTAIMIVLFLCLWRYTKDILMAKIKMFIALLGMAIAGPLMFTGKKRLVNTGRDLMAVILVSFIEITVHSLMFDAIIYGTSIIISPSLFRLIITFFLLLLLWKFNAALNERIKSFTTGIENSVMSSGSIVKDAKRSMETALSRKPHEFLANKSAAYDAAHPDQAGGLKSKLLRMAADSTASASQKKGFTKITMESMKDQKKARAATAQEELENKENAVNSVLDSMSNQEQTMQNALNERAEELRNDASQWSAEAKQAEVARKTAEAQFEALAQSKANIEANMEAYKAQMKAELAALGEANDAAAVDAKYNQVMEKYDKKLSELNNTVNEQQSKVNLALTKQTIETTESLNDKQKQGLSDKLASGNTLAQAIKAEVQESNKEVLTDAIKELNKEANKQANVKLDGARIGAPKVVNEKAVATANASNLMLQEIEAGIAVDTLDDSKNLMEAVTKATVMQNSFDRNNNSAYVATTEYAGNVREKNADMKAAVAEEVKDEKGIVRGIANGSAKVVAGISNMNAEVVGAVGTAATSVAATVTESGRAIARVGAADISVQNAQNANSAVSAILAAKQSGTTDQAAIAAAAKQASDAYQKQKHEKMKKTASEATVVDGAPAPGVAPGTPITRDQFVHDENRMTADKGKPQAQPQSPAASRPDIMNAASEDAKPKKKGFFSRNNPDDYE